MWGVGLLGVWAVMLSWFSSSLSFIVVGWGVSCPLQEGRGKKNKQKNGQKHERTEKKEHPVPSGMGKPIKGRKPKKKGGAGEESWVGRSKGEWRGRPVGLGGVGSSWFWDVCALCVLLPLLVALVVFGSLGAWFLEARSPDLLDG